MSETSAPDILLVGGGKMGGALLAGWLAQRSVGQVIVIDPGPAAAGLAGPQVRVLADPSAIPADFRPRILLLAVKPQMMAAVAPGYARFVEAGASVLSIAAGVTLARFAGWYGAAAPVIRAMPNTPAAIGRGVTVMVANDRVDNAARDLAGRLLAAVGAVEWVADEGLIDAVTALSGGGPAYVFLLIETLAIAGARAGLPADLAMRLARQTVTGAGELAHISPEPAAALRQAVTSPNGTTQAALAVLMAEDGIQPLFDRAIQAATDRSRELASA